MTFRPPSTRIPRPKTVEEYVDLVDQAIFEVEELRMAAEYDMESLGNAMGFVNDLERQLREMRLSMSNGSYHFGRQDLPFMSIVEKQSDRVLPFKYLFRVINETHLKGLGIDEA